MCLVVFYASQCEVLLGTVFAPCHGYISPNIYQQQCRYQACRCGSSCLCTALAHYAYLCSKHGVNINFRSQVSECGKFPQSGFFLDINLCLCDFSSYWYEIQVYTAPKCRHCKGIAEDCNLPQKNKFVLFSVCDIQEWCVLVEWCTTRVCRLVAGPVGHCPAMRHVPLMIVPRDAAVQTAVFMMMCASAVCSCKP